MSLPVSPLFLSLLAGLIVSNYPRVLAPFRNILAFAAKRLLRVGVALLGFQITFNKIAEIGSKGFIAILTIVLLTFLSIRWSAKFFGIGTELALLIAGGFSICGASAVAALGASRKSKNEDISYAIGIVTLCGTLSIFAIPPISKVLHLSQQISGSWIGAAVHDVGQVVATASVVGGSTLSFAIIAKLSRVILLAPMLVSVNLKKNTQDIRSKREILLSWFPPFILSFLAITCVNNYLHLSIQESNFFITLSKTLLSVGLFSMASMTSLGSIRTIGAKPLLFGVLAWIVWGGLSLAIIQVI
jgi:uncharacterized integral membrane protein (TIGR00698 family)